MAGRLMELFAVVVRRHACDGSEGAVERAFVVEARFPRDVRNRLCGVVAEQVLCGFNADPAQLVHERVVGLVVGQLGEECRHSGENSRTLHGCGEDIGGAVHAGQCERTIGVDLDDDLLVGSVGANEVGNRTVVDEQ